MQGSGKGGLHLIFDFDSTLVTLESLDELAALALQGAPDQGGREEEIRRVTALGMEGKIPFSESLAKRMALFSADRTHVNTLIQLLTASLSPSVLRHKEFFAESSSVYVLSSGFREYIAPTVAHLGIPGERVIANTFLWEGDRIVGADPQSPLARDKGKVAAVAALGLEGAVYMIGDGYTDYEVRSSGAAEAFIAYTENVARPPVVSVADYRVANMEELLYLLGNTLS